MMYPFMTLDDGTEVVFSAPLMSDSGEQIKVYFETPVYGGFKSAYCVLPDYVWENDGYNEKELAKHDEFIRSVAHLIIQFSRQGGIGCAANL